MLLDMTKKHILAFIDEIVKHTDHRDRLLLALLIGNVIGRYNEKFDMDRFMVDCGVAL